MRNWNSKRGYNRYTIHSHIVNKKLVLIAQRQFMHNVEDWKCFLVAVIEELDCFGLLLPLKAKS
jgi:hypothetical protein